MREGNEHIWYVSLERAEAIWADIEARRKREIGDDELRDRLLRHGMPRGLEPNDHLNIQIVKRVQTGSKPRITLHGN